MKGEKEKNIQKTNITALVLNSAIGHVIPGELTASFLNFPFHPPFAFSKHFCLYVSA